MINDEEMSQIIYRAVRRTFGDAVDLPYLPASFEVTAAATGQRFRVTVEEVMSPARALAHAQKAYGGG